MIAIYGDKDPSFIFVELLRDYRCEKFNYNIIENIDHNFTNNLEKFVKLPTEYLL